MSSTASSGAHGRFPSLFSISGDCYAQRNPPWTSQVTCMKREITSDGVDVNAARFLNCSVANFERILLGRGPHKNCKNDLDDQT